MITISLCMIVKNEEDVIGNCLESIKDVVDEINIVDTGCTDRTLDIVKKYTDRIYYFKWIDDFAAARNFSFDKATKDYILWLDADDVLLKEDVEKLKNLKSTLNPDIDCVTFLYNYAQDAEGNPALIFRRERLVKRENKFPWIGFIHEYIGGNKKHTIDADIIVTHKRLHGDSDRNLNIYKKKLEEGVEFSNRDIYYYGKELYYHGMHDEAIKIFKSLLSVPIWIEEKIDIICKLADCYVATGDKEKSINILLSSFEVAPPRAEVIYRLGQTFEMLDRYYEAIYWYESIQHAKKPEDRSGFIYEELWSWRTYIQLCVCYNRVGDIDTAYIYHEKARNLQPKNECIIQNSKFFESIGYVKK